MALPLSKKTRRGAARRASADDGAQIATHGNCNDISHTPLRHQRLCRRKRGTEWCSRHRWPQVSKKSADMPDTGSDPASYGGGLLAGKSGK